ncbi:MAG TPA: multicopper oxidase domain-containing protein [Polyangia bacterium]|nr:multicopper oxidase domain-containing protein [Polyangia bacterium]
MSRRTLQKTAWAATALFAACSSSSNTPNGKDAAVTTDAPADAPSEATTTTIMVPPTQPTLDGAMIAKYVDDVPTFAGKRVDGSKPVSVDMVEFQQPMLPAAFYASLPAPYNAGTYLWGYALNGAAPSFPATTIEATQNTPTVVTYTNSLENADGAPLFLSQRIVTDLTIHWADPFGVTRTNGCMTEPPLPQACLALSAAPPPAVPHLHGGQVLSDFDGMPDSWFTPGLAQKGPAFVSNVYRYPNHQDATTLWFHDHALGVVRQNVYAGLAGVYLVRDGLDTGAAGNALKLPAGPYEAELLVADRQFDINGQLYFPAGLPGNGPGLNGAPPNPDHHPYWIPEFFGDVMTVNGKSWPVMHVEPRRYRLRFVNGSNARFVQMQLFVAQDGTPTPAPGPAIWQIGSDGGLLNAPTNLAGNAIPGVFLAPAERADVIVDFSGKSGSFILMNGAGCAMNPDSCGAFAPFPSGDPPDPDTTGQVMMFTVDRPLVGADATFNPAAPGATLRGGAGAPPTIVNLRASPTIDVHRQLVLVEVEGAGGPEEVLLNNSKWSGLRENEVPNATPQPIPGSVPNGHGVAATENPQVGATEVWEIANLTEDAHPIHIHLIQFQLINREDMTVGADGDDTIYRGDWDAAFPGGTFDGMTFAPGTFIPGYGPPADYATPNADGAVGGNLAFGGATYLTGNVTPPAASEAGWKDTIKVLPKSVTRVVMRFAPQSVPLGDTAPGTNQFSFDPTAPGPGYVWHCHILDHEDNEMMRPYLLKK